MNEMKSFLDGISVSALGATLLGWLPHVTAIAVAIWAIYRIREVRLSIKIKQLELEALIREQSRK